MQQKVLKVISVLLIVVMLCANSTAVISYAADTLLSESEIFRLNKELSGALLDIHIGYDSTYYDTSYFDYMKSFSMSNEPKMLYIYFKPKKFDENTLECRLENFVIDFSDSNFEILDAKGKDIYNIRVDSENKKIIISGESNIYNFACIEVEIAPEKKELVDENAFNKDNYIKISGQYMQLMKRDDLFTNGSIYAKEERIEKTAVIRTGWHTENEKAVLNYETTKYIPYAVKNTNKIIIQGKLTSNLEKNSLPIKETNLEVVAPKIGDEYPESVNVIADETTATNGDTSGESFNSNNWSYDKTTGKINIKVNNGTEGKVSWIENSKDVYTITYIYSNNVYNVVKDSVVRISYSANSKISLYNDGTGVNNLTAQTSGYDDQIKKLGEIVDFETSSTKSINKGYIYTNKISSKDDKRKTYYNTYYTAKISYADAIDKINFEQAIDTFKTEDGKEFSAIVGGKNYTLNETLLIPVEEFNKILGQDGSIKILNNGTQLSEVNSKSRVASKEEVNAINKNMASNGGFYILDLSDLNANQITIETSKPVKEGNLTISLTKIINTDVDYSKNQIKQFNSLNMTVTANAFNGDTKIATAEKETSVKLEEPTQKVSIKTNKDSLSTIIENKDVEINATLETDSEDDVLYTNPKVTINLPSNIESIKVKNAKLYFDDELKIKEAKLVDNENGTKSIIATLEGTQTKYNNVVAKGATLTILADITLNKLTPSTDTTIGLVVENSDGTTAKNNCKISYAAPTGVVTTNSISNYKDNSEELMSISEEQEALIPTLSKSLNAIFKMNVINNYNYSLSNVAVLGRFPFANNKDVVTNQNLGSNMTLTLTEGISVSGIDSSKVTIYYSTNGEADKDLSKSQNGWTTNINNLQNIKSYMIVLNDYTMEKGNNFTFTYKAQIPANLEHNKSAYENYVVYYDGNTSTNEKSKAQKIGITTGDGAKISAKLESEQSGQNIKNGNILKYKLTVENTGTDTAKNLKVTMSVNESMTYVEKDENSSLGYKNATGIEGYTDENGNKKYRLNITLEDVKPQSSITKEIWLLVDANAEATKFETNATITNGDVKAETSSTSVNLTKTYFRTQTAKSVENVNDNETFGFTMFVRSSEQNSDYDKNGQEVYNGNRSNTIISVQVPSELSLDTIKLEDEDITKSATVKNGRISINIGDVGKSNARVTIRLKATMKDANIYEKNVSFKTYIKADNIEEQELETLSITVNKPGLEIKQASSIPTNTKVKVGEKFSYTFTVKNLANTMLNSITLTDYLPKNVTMINAEFKIGDIVTKTSEKDENGNAVMKIGILEGKQTATVTIDVVATKVDTDTTIENKAEVKNSKVGTITVNSVQNTIQAYNPENDDVIEPDEETRKITGTVWYDENQNGAKDSEEKIAKDVEVLLLDNATGNIAKDAASEDLITKTDENGEYAFSNVKKGKYTVIFFYDSANYSATAYQKEGVDTTKNSDAIDKDVVYEGKTRKAGVTEEIILQQDNVYNIDLGLVADKKFDLKLDKVVNKITLNSNNQSKVVEYNKKFAKIDIASKDSDSTTMIVEYKITITNEGAIPGYAKKIVDYLPDRLKFSTELNKDWYTGKESNTIYNSALANTIINPGESKEVTLILTTKVSEENYGMITNNAEIYEASNDYGLTDVDSTPGNKNTAEDDYSTANILLGVKTGQILIYATLTITIIAIIGTGVYMIKKKVLR